MVSSLRVATFWFAAMFTQKRFFKIKLEFVFPKRKWSKICRKTFRSFSQSKSLRKATHALERAVKMLSQCKLMVRSEFRWVAFVCITIQVNNHAAYLDFLQNVLQIQLTEISAASIFEGDLKSILRLLFALSQFKKQQIQLQKAASAASAATVNCTKPPHQTSTPVCNYRCPSGAMPSNANQSAVTTKPESLTR